jgi:Domain of unknown function (DUF6438)
MTSLSLNVAVVLALVGWTGACRSSSGGHPNDSPAEKVDPSARQTALGDGISAVRLERGPCFGTCPVYVLDVDSTGRVQFEGRAHVRVLGTASHMIGKDNFRAIAARLVEAGFPSWQASYLGGGQHCGNYATDLPVVILSATIDGVPKRVAHDYGCSGAPRALRELHRMIDSVANSPNWMLES